MNERSPDAENVTLRRLPRDAVSVQMRVVKQRAHGGEPVLLTGDEAAALSNGRQRVRIRHTPSGTDAL